VKRNLQMRADGADAVDEPAPWPQMSVATMTDHRLVLLPPSPWSERARWVFAHHGLSYTTIEHVPFLGERRLRRLAGQKVARATVPVLLAGNDVIVGSWDIARYADRNGGGTPLIPVESERDIRRWFDAAEHAMSKARALTVAALLANDEALAEGLPPSLPRFLRPLLLPLARHGMRWFARKYELNMENPEPARAAVVEQLDELRATLVHADYICSTFSFADIVMATFLQGVAPVADRYIPLGPATRQVFAQAGLAARYRDLIEWRDRLYERHRTPPAS
jgi:glutathione S-transferase